MELPEPEREQTNNQILLEYDVARLELEQVALGILAPANVQYAQRIPIYLIIYRTLLPLGLFLTDGRLEEIASLQQIDFEILAFAQELIRPEQGWDGIFYEAVVQKPAD